MGQAAPHHVFSAADYLAWEALQPERHEYLDGEVFAMAGVEDRHVTVAGNLYIAQRQPVPHLYERHAPARRRCQQLFLP